MPGRGGRRIVAIQKQNETLFRWISGKPGSPTADNEGIQWASCKMRKYEGYGTLSNPPSPLEQKALNIIKGTGYLITGIVGTVFVFGTVVTFSGITMPAAAAISVSGIPSAGAITLGALTYGIPLSQSPLPAPTGIPRVHTKIMEKKTKFISFNKPCLKDSHAGLY